LRSSKSNGTWKQYEGSLTKWSEYCKLNNLSCSDVNINNYLCFLTSLYEKGLSYMSINTARSALSSVFGKIDGGPIGENKLVTDFMRGVSKLRPPRARYSTTWDPDKVLNVIKSWKTQEADLKQISFKLIALLALVTGQRVQSLSSIKISNIIWENPVQIKLTSILKTTSITNNNPVLVIPPYHDKDLCPINTLNEYLRQTSSIRNGKDELFLSFIKPHSPVTSSSLSRWLTEVLKLAGIDCDQYHAHSFRHAATSKVAARGVSVDTILKQVGWTRNSKVFAKFYNKPIEERAEFANSILNV
jgi:integrase